MLLLLVFFSSPNGMTCWIRNHSQSFAKQIERLFSSSSLKFKRKNNKNKNQSQSHQILHTQNRIINGGILLFLLYSVACIYWKGRLCSDSSSGLGLETFGVSCRSNDVLGGAQSEVWRGHFHRIDAMCMWMELFLASVCVYGTYAIVFVC